jgi:hypothetical protein
VEYNDGMDREHMIVEALMWAREQGEDADEDGPRRLVDAILGVYAATAPGSAANGADRTASVVIRGHAFIQNLRPGGYELGVDASPVFRLATAFDELQLAI